MRVRKYFLFLIFCLQLVQADLFARVSNDAHEPWMDSVIAEGVRKIGEAEAWRVNGGGMPRRDWVTGETYGSHCIVIDAANWIPDVQSGAFYFERDENMHYSEGSFQDIRDSVDQYNMRFAQSEQYIPYYNIVILNFPFRLEKDLSTAASEDKCMFAQLQALGYIRTDSYSVALQKFYQIIETVTFNANTIHQKPIVTYGCANMLGQYDRHIRSRASYCAELVSSSGLDSSQMWVRQLYQIPTMLRVPLILGSITDKNGEVSMAVRNFLMCNRYGLCIMSAGVFQNMYARWLFENLKDNTFIDKPLLFSTCLRLNGLTQEMAWAVLTAEYETGHDQYNQTALGNLYNSYNNQTLQQILFYADKIQRAQVALKTQPEIGRDSGLYYCWLVYRVPSYMSTIPTSQRIRLIDVITNATCQDVHTAGDYQEHCEPVCSALCTTVPTIEERAFLDELKSKKLIWDLSYRIDDNLFGFFGKDHYTDIIFTLSAQWMRAFPEEAGDENYLTIKWEDDYFNANGSVSADHQNNTVTIMQVKQLLWLTAPTGSYTVDIFSPVTIRVEEGDWMPGLQGVQYITVPAFFLDWLYHEKRLNDLGTTAHIALNVVALTVGIGEVYYATTWGMRLIYGIQVAMTVTDWILMDAAAKEAIIGCFADTALGRKVVEAYQMISLTVNLTVAAKGLVYGCTNAQKVFAEGYDANQNALRTGLGPTSTRFKALEKLRESIAAVKTSTQWLDEIELVLGVGSKYKIQGWIDAGLDAQKTELAFVSATNKVELFDKLNSAKSIYHQRVHIEDWDNIPGVIKSQHIPNGLTVAQTNPSWADPSLDLPLEEAINFTDATAVELTSGTKLYRVTGGYKAGAYWTLQKPNSIADVIGGTAVQPKWNSFETIYVYEIPQGSTLKVWKGGTASQPLDPTVLNPHLPGGAEQVFIPQSLRDENFATLVDETTRPW